VIPDCLAFPALAQKAPSEFGQLPRAERPSKSVTKASSVIERAHEDGPRERVCCADRGLAREAA